MVELVTDSSWLSQNLSVQCAEKWLGLLFVVMSLKLFAVPENIQWHTTPTEGIVIS